MIVIAIIVITVLLLLITAVSMHKRRIARESQRLDEAIFRRIEEEWKE